MEAFFTPKSWENNIEMIQFKSTGGKFSTGKKVKAKKQKKPAANPTSATTLEQPEKNTPKILSGNIEKKKNKKKKKQKPQPTIGAAVAVGEANIQQKKKKNKPAQVDAEPASSSASPLTATVSQKKVKNNKKKQLEQNTKDVTDTKVKSGRVEKNKPKKKKAEQVKLTQALKAAEDTETTEPSGVNELAAQLKQSLMGGRFRYINEQLYTMDSKQAKHLFRQEPDAFEAYHEGYRHQVEKWPLNPLNRIIKMVRRLPKTHEIGDFGCGEGRLAQAVPNKVHSLDLVAAREDIIACDMACTPLSAQSLDVAVYCLSLMGTNLHEYLLEANRVLKSNGLLLIAEIQSRFDADLRPFLRALDAAGFKLIKRDGDSKVFFFFQFKKVRDVGKVAKLPPIALKPCLYKKR